MARRHIGLGAIIANGFEEGLGRVGGGPGFDLARIVGACADGRRAADVQTPGRSDGPGGVVFIAVVVRPCPQRPGEGRQRVPRPVRLHLDARRQSEHGV
ncbi:hypothetical protein D3C87_1190870 [compost metagenome]